MATQQQWWMRGDVMEACSCTTTCPCNFGSVPTERPCGAVIGWRIEEGSYGNTRLDGLNIVLYLRIPGYAFDGGWTTGAYFDARASREQMEGLETIFSGRAGGWPAALSGLITKQLPPKQAPITYEHRNGDCDITVPGLLEVSTERVSNPMPGQPPLDPKVMDLAVPFYTGKAAVRRSRILRLTDPEMSFEYSGRSSLIGRFEYTGP
jgi:hypothetical protein